MDSSTNYSGESDAFNESGVALSETSIDSSFVVQSNIALNSVDVQP